MSSHAGATQRINPLHQQSPYGSGGGPTLKIGDMEHREVSYGAPSQVHCCYKVTLVFLAIPMAYCITSLIQDAIDEKSYDANLTGAFYGLVASSTVALSILGCMGCNCYNQRTYLSLIKFLETPVPTDPELIYNRVEKGLRLYTSCRPRDPEGELFRKVVIDEENLAKYMIISSEFCSGQELLVALNVRTVKEEGKSDRNVQVATHSPFSVANMRRELQTAANTHIGSSSDALLTGYNNILDLIQTEA